MAFVEKIINENEKLVGVARLHWIYAAKGLAILLGLILAGGILKVFLLPYAAFSALANAVFWISLFIGVIVFLFYYIAMLTSELGLTDERVIYKRGWIMVKVRDIDLEEIKSESVDNGVLGRILNYGYLHLDSRLVDDIALPAIADPYRFLKALHSVREKMKEDSMKVVLETSNPAQKVAHGLKDLQKNKDNKSNNGDVKQLSDDSYEALSDDATDNVREMQDEANLDKKEKPEKRELFVHKEALRDMPIDDFDEAADIDGDTPKK